MLLARLHLLRIPSGRLVCIVGRSFAKAPPIITNANPAEPIKYTESKAHKEWKSRRNWEPEPRNDWTYYVQGYFWYFLWFCAMGSLFWGIFIAEPSDPNKPWLKPIWEIDPSLERPMMERFLVDRARNNLPVQHIRERLKQLEAEGR